MKAIVTGAAGFLGSHLTDKLLHEGYKVVGIDNLSNSSLENLRQALEHENFKFIRADLLEPETWIGEFKDAEIVFHLAANPEVRHSVREPLEHYHQNLTATMHVLEATRRHNVGTIVYASSSTVYGDPETIPTPETHPRKPISVYGATKAAGEILVETYARLYKMKALILRYANIVGPRLSHGVIYDFLIKLQRNPYKLEILGDGTQKKSYIHVSDAVEATLQALKNHIERGEGAETYNIGNKDWITVKQIADTITKTLRLQQVKYTYKPATKDGRG